MSSSPKTQRVAVVGAGIIGLSTAWCLKERHPDLPVHIIADKFSPYTVSDISAGFWQPYLLGDTPMGLQVKWSKDTFVHMMKVHRMADTSDAGVQMISGYVTFKERVEDPYWKDIVLGFRHMTEEEVAQFEGQTHGWFFTTYGAESKYYLPWIMRKLKDFPDVKVFNRKLNSLSELAGEYDIVVNCTGLGARELVNDRQVQPIRGQVMRVKAPWIKYFFNNEDLSDIYLLPVVDSVVVGGTHQVSSWDLQPSEEDKKRIWEGVCKFIPSLRGAKIENDFVGLRPSRPSVRLELEDVNSGRGKLTIVHNYGHGGAGVTLHWGCAVDAAQLVEDAMRRLALKSKY
ncbi:D-aspartate oxidase [Lingula anatina]|uniref:D-aspartate oxidase n=1 Tax=Lingula anatina TaxID=7574 RepID=A0A1S3JCA7_LINAN|nr:D-aspartate oxidase [Lingula anatina]|eukprot:XP_013407821.1 D-aspartate oxidase [Lingula anatina]